MEDLRLLEIPLFSGLDRIDLAKLIPELERVNYQPGENLFNQGDPGDSLFIIIDGTARVFLLDSEKGEQEIRTMGPKECFGEMALLTGESRSAGVQAVTELSVLKLSKERFDTLLKKHHSLAIYFAGVLARRLATAHRDLQYCKELIAKEGRLKEQITATTIVRRKPKSSRIAQSILNKPLLGIILAVLLCSLSTYLLYSVGIQRSHIILIELTLVAAVIWSIDILSFYVVAIPCLSSPCFSARPHLKKHSQAFPVQPGFWCWAYLPFLRPLPKRDSSIAWHYWSSSISHQTTQERRWRSHSQDSSSRRSSPLQMQELLWLLQWH